MWADCARLNEFAKTCVSRLITTNYVSRNRKIVYDNTAKTGKGETQPAGDRRIANHSQLK